MLNAMFRVSGQPLYFLQCLICVCGGKQTNVRLKDKDFSVEQPRQKMVESLHLENSRRDHESFMSKEYYNHCYGGKNTHHF